MNKIVPVLWLMLAAVIVGGCIGVKAHADPTDVIDVPHLSDTPCVMLVPGEWRCPEGFAPPPLRS